MTEIYVSLPKKENIDFYLENPIQGFFLGIENFSINFNHYIKLEELDDYINIVKKRNKLIYITLNKLFYDSQIDDLKKLLFDLSKYDIAGVTFCDAAVYNIVKENNLNINLVWNSYHLGTNYKTVEFWQKRKIEKILLSTELTIDEIIDIKKNTNMKVGVFLYGYLNMATSSRSLISNYFSFIGKEKKYDKYYMEDKISNKKYPIVEKKGETNFFSAEVLNGIEYFPKLIENNIDFIELNDYMIESNKFYNIMETFCALINAPEDKEFVKKLKQVGDANTDVKTSDGFLNKKTVFKVKDYE